MKTNSQIVKAWLSAFNKQDAEKLLELYAERGIHISDVAKKDSRCPNGILRKKDMKRWWDGVFRALGKVKYELDSTVDGQKTGGDVVVEYHYTVKENTERVEMRFLIDEGKILVSQVLK